MISIIDHQNVSYILRQIIRYKSVSFIFSTNNSAVILFCLYVKVLKSFIIAICPYERKFRHILFLFTNPDLSVCYILKV